MDTGFKRKIAIIYAFFLVLFEILLLQSKNRGDPIYALLFISALFLLSASLVYLFYFSKFEEVLEKNSKGKR